MLVGKITGAKKIKNTEKLVELIFLYVYTDKLVARLFLPK